jgi:hypothetical protein
MKYGEKALATIKSKQFIIGMITTGILTASVAAPSAAGALSLSGSSGSDGRLPASNAIQLGGMVDGSLQGSAWSTQGSHISSGKSTSHATATNMAGGKGSGALQVQNTNGTTDDTPSSTNMKADGQVSGETSAEAQNAADTGDDTGSQQGDSSSSTNLQGGVGLAVSLSADSSANTDDNSLLGL